MIFYSDHGGNTYKSELRIHKSYLVFIDQLIFDKLMGKDDLFNRLYQTNGHPHVQP
jgi:hypothetical protein